MIDTEVVRLRNLRSSALRVRAVARALVQTRSAQNDAVLNASACAAWRVARAVSGRLRAHPYASFQRDVGLASVVANSLVAATVAASATSRVRAFRGFSRELRKMARELEHARALTWVPGLSDSFGRSLNEFRPLLARVEKEARPVATRHRQVATTRANGTTAAYAPTESVWPYLAL